jgi:hypothetical protein
VQHHEGSSERMTNAEIGGGTPHVRRYRECGEHVQTGASITFGDTVTAQDAGFFGVRGGSEQFV